MDKRAAKHNNNNKKEQAITGNSSLRTVSRIPSEKTCGNEDDDVDDKIILQNISKLQTTLFAL